MKCPKCHAALKPAAVAGVEIDRCTACNGQWYDDGEVAKLVPLLAEIENAPGADLTRNLQHPQAAPPAHTLPCPRCQGTMRTFNYAYDSNIMLDRCDACRGIWLDAGECNAIIRHVRGNPKLNRMGEAIAKNIAEAHQRQDVIEKVVGWNNPIDDAQLLVGIFRALRGAA